MITTFLVERFTRDVLAVPPLCRNSDFSLNVGENVKLMRHIEGGGVRTLIYGGNANLYHVGAAEYGELLGMLESCAGKETLVIPSVGPTFGTMIEQAAIVRRHKFPTVMVLPMQGAATGEGVELGIRKFVEAAGVPAVLYVRAENYVEPKRIAALFAEQVICALKYAVVRSDTRDDKYLRAICDICDARRIVSGLGEQPAIVHMRDFGVGGFTAGVVCVAPRISAAMLGAVKAKNWAEVERLRELCVPLEELRNAGNPIRVLHEAVRLAGIAETGPLLPLLSNIPESQWEAVRNAAMALMALDRGM